jgi:site-specific DNA recombinase
MLVTVKEHSLAIQLDRAKLCVALNLTPTTADEIVQSVVIDLPMRIRKRGVEMKLVIGGNEVKNMDTTLIKAIARGRAWFKELVDGKVASIAELARREGLNTRYVAQQIELAFLSPTIVETILQGRQPVELTFECLKRMGDLPRSWSDQKRCLGIT